MLWIKKHNLAQWSRIPYWSVPELNLFSCIWYVRKYLTKPNLVLIWNRIQRKSLISSVFQIFQIHYPDCSNIFLLFQDQILHWTSKFSWVVVFRFSNLFIFPKRQLHVQTQKWRYQNHVRNIFKVNNKDPKTTSRTS